MHNRLIASAALTAEERRETAREIAKRLGEAKAPVHFILPVQGIEEWDREGQPAHDPDALAVFMDEIRMVIREPVAMTEIDAHINDPEFAEAALRIFDDWVARGIIRTTA